MDPKKLFTPREVAEVLQVSPATIYAELERGNLRHQRVGRRYIITRRHLETYLSPETVDELVGANREPEPPWLDAAAADMARGIAAAEQDVPTAEFASWLEAMEAAVKPLPVDQ